MVNFRARAATSLLLLLSLITNCGAASVWSFNEGSLSIQGKAAGVGGGQKIDLNPKKVASKPITLKSTDNVKIQWTATEGGSAKKPHQAMLLVREQETGLETFFAAQTRESGKCNINFSYKDLPTQLVLSQKPLQATVVIASFGESAGYLQQLFEIVLEHDPHLALPKLEAQPRYGKKEHIYHTFKQGFSQGPLLLTLFFIVAILVTIPAVYVVWIQVGGNISSAAQAFKTAPASHSIFLGSILSLQAIFFMYYIRWNLFEMLPPAAIAAIAAFVSGGRALTELQDRRLEAAEMKLNPPMIATGDVKS